MIFPLFSTSSVFVLFHVFIFFSVISHIFSDGLAESRCYTMLITFKEEFE